MTALHALAKFRRLRRVNDDYIPAKIRDLVPEVSKLGKSGFRKSGMEAIMTNNSTRARVPQKVTEVIAAKRKRFAFHYVPAHVQERKVEWPLRH